MPSFHIQPIRSPSKMTNKMNSIPVPTVGRIPTVTVTAGKCKTNEATVQVQALQLPSKNRKLGYLYANYTNK